MIKPRTMGRIVKLGELARELDQIIREDGTYVSEAERARVADLYDLAGMRYMAVRIRGKRNKRESHAQKEARRIALAEYENEIMAILQEAGERGINPRTIMRKTKLAPTEFYKYTRRLREEGYIVSERYGRNQVRYREEKEWKPNDLT